VFTIRLGRSTNTEEHQGTLRICPVVRGLASSLRLSLKEKPTTSLGVLFSTGIESSLCGSSSHFRFADHQL
ncbi:unnamed protein product, partial [Amoebophrya sp. A120]